MHEIIGGKDDSPSQSLLLWAGGVSLRIRAISAGSKEILRGRKRSHHAHADSGSKCHHGCPQNVFGEGEIAHVPTYGLAHGTARNHRVAGREKSRCWIGFLDRKSTRL